MIYNFLVLTNRDKAKGYQDKVLIYKEKLKLKDEKYGALACEHNASFRGLTFYDPGRMGPNIHTLHCEVFNEYKQTHKRTEAEDDFRMLWYPKQWSTECPKHLWKARMLVRERCVTAYIAKLREI